MNEIPLVLSYFFFFIDIGRHFITGYIEEMEEVKDIKLISKRYLSTKFVSHLLTAFPYQCLHYHYVSFISCIRIVNISNYKQLIDKMLILPRTRAALRMLYIVCELLIFTHLSACILNTTIISNREWRPPLDWVNAGTP